MVGGAPGREKSEGRACPEHLGDSNEVPAPWGSVALTERTLCQTVISHSLLLGHHLPSANNTSQVIDCSLPGENKSRMSRFYCYLLRFTLTWKLGLQMRQQVNPELVEINRIVLEDRVQVC